MYTTTAKNDAISDARNDNHHIIHDLHDAANQAGRKVRKIINTVSDNTAHASEKVTKEIRANPVRSSALALSIGVLLGALLRR